MNRNMNMNIAMVPLHTAVVTFERSANGTFVNKVRLAKGHSQVG